jgi:tetratricopeptide (TPR) repeat protein
MNINQDSTRHLIGLGYRCDVAFQLRMHGAENVAHFFDWLAIPIEGVIKTIEADFDVFYPDHLVLNTKHDSHCVEDKLTGTLFHHQFPLFAGHMQPDFLLHYEPFIKKFQHLAARFRSYMETKPVTLVRRIINQKQAFQLEDVVLKRFPRADVRFLYIVNDGKEFETPHGRACALKHNGKSLGDPAEWVRVLTEERLIGEPYRHGTVEILGAAHDDHNLSTDNRFTEEQLYVAMRANPQNIAFPLELARLYELNNQWRKAEEMALAALARAPQNREAQFQAALAQWQLGTLPVRKVAEIFERLVAGEAPEVRWIREASAACLAAGRPEDALLHANRAVRADPADQRNYLQKVSCLYQERNFPETELALAAAMRLGPIGKIPQHIFARILDWRGEVEEAMQVEQALVKSHPQFFPSLFHLGELAMKRGQSGEAVAYYQAALPIAGNHRAAVEKILNDLGGMAA